MYDAIIIGARCAGSPLARLLARRGYRILLVDRATFPSDTLSTHFVHRSGAANLKSWGLLDKLRATGCPPIQKLIVDYGSGVRLAGRPSPADDLAEGYCPRRKVLDQILVDAAVEAGVELRQGFSVQEITRDGDRVTGLRGRSKGGATVTEQARLVIGADGMHSLLAGAVQAPTYHERPALTCCYYSYWSGVSLEGAESYRLSRRAILAWPTHESLTCIAVWWPRQEFERFRADIEGNYLKTLELAPNLIERVLSGRREERFAGTADVPNFFRKPYGQGWALVGDAGHHKDPLPANGISDAFRDAELLATAIDQGFSGRRPLEETLAEYERKRNEAAMEHYELACKLAALKPVPPKALEFLAALNENQQEVDRFLRVGQDVKSSEFYSPENLKRILGADRYTRLFGQPEKPATPADQQAIASSDRSSSDTSNRQTREQPNSPAAQKRRLHDLTCSADSYRVQGQYAKAEPLYLEALALAEVVFGPGHLTVSTLCNNLAVLYKYTGKFDQAERLYGRALQIIEQTLGEDHAEVATIYHNLGGLEHARGRYSSGEPLARRSVEIREKALGPDQVDVAADIAALAAILDGQGKYDESEPLYHRALSIFERTYGPEHYESAINLNNLAALKQAQGRHAEAGLLYNRALAIKEKLLGPVHPDVAMTLNNLAVLLKAQGKGTEAAQLYERALVIFEQTLGQLHPKVITCRENYARLRKMRAIESESSAINRRIAAAEVRTNEA